MGIRRAAAALLLSAAAVVATATPAFAQTELNGSSPRQGALIAAPKLIVLSFTEHVTLPANPITVTGGNGVSWTVDKATAVGPVVTAPVRRIGPPGPYTLSYKVVAEDGDTVTGTISFTLIPRDITPAARPPSSGTATAAPPVTAAPTASNVAPHGGTHVVVPGAVSDATSTSDLSGIPAWVWVLGVVVVLAVGLLEALRVGRTGGPEAVDRVKPRARRNRPPDVADRQDDPDRHGLPKAGDDG